MGESPEAICGSFLEVDVGSGRPPLWWEAAVARREESLELLICVKCYGGGERRGHNTQGMYVAEVKTRLCEYMQCCMQKFLHKKGGGPVGCK